jgi:NAD-dependent deacetylase
MDKIKELKKMIDESKNIVVFTGAGVSTDSGLKDFRGKDGLYTKKNFESAEYMLSSACFYNQPEAFYEYYKENFNCLDKEPNIAHKFFKELENIGKLKAIITQNIDGLHTKAGNKTVYEIHGTVYKNHCLKCHKEYSAEYIFNSAGVPTCSCGGTIKPDVVLYGEMLPDDAYMGGLKAIDEADMLIVCGSSLTVYPASGMIDAFRGKYLVIINGSKTPCDYKANLVINDRLANIFDKIR